MYLDRMKLHPAIAARVRIKLVNLLFRATARDAAGDERAVIALIQQGSPSAVASADRKFTPLFDNTKSVPVREAEMGEISLSAQKSGPITIGTVVFQNLEALLKSIKERDEGGAALEPMGESDEGGASASGAGAGGSTGIAALTAKEEELITAKEEELIAAIKKSDEGGASASGAGVRNPTPTGGKEKLGKDERQPAPYKGGSKHSQRGGAYDSDEALYGTLGLSYGNMININYDGIYTFIPIDTYNDIIDVNTTMKYYSSYMIKKYDLPKESGVSGVAALTEESSVNGAEGVPLSPSDLERTDSAPASGGSRRYRLLHKHKTRNHRRYNKKTRRN
jgi:hypothetical protein